MIIPDLSDKHEVNIQDAVFVLRVVSSKVYRSLISRLSFLREVSGKLSKESFENLEAQNPQKYEEVNEKLHEVFRDFIKQGVCGHSGIKRKDGSDAPFIADEKGLVSDETLEVYDMLRVTYVLATEVISFNTMPEIDKKN
jgi:hypothetical protein